MSSEFLVKQTLIKIIENAKFDCERENYKWFHLNFLNDDRKSFAGDYDMRTHIIRVFVPKTSAKTNANLICTTLHEVSHHIDWCNRHTSDHSDAFYEIFQKLLYSALDLNVVSVSDIKNMPRLNEIDDKLKKTPLKYYAEFLKTNVFDNIKYKSSAEDFIGRFYGEFMSYSGGDGQTLGIVLTPAHICELFCDLLNVQPNDIILDPTCGTAGFLVAAMHHMISATENETKRKNIRKKQLHGYELQSNMFAIACTNMILRDDGNSNIWCQDFLKQNPAQVQLKGATVGMMNPPYSQGTKDDPSQYELSFVEHLLDSLVVGARAAVIVPQSSMTGKTKAEQAFKASIMKNHTLEGVITCNTDTFYGVGTNPVIAVFTAHEPHPEDKLCKFIDFRDDGYEVRAHVGLVEGDSAKDKKQHLLDVWNGRVEAPSKFCVESTVKADDEWLHSFYYFNDEIPTDSDFEKAIGDYLTFEFSMIMENREYLFEGDGDDAKS